MRRHAIVLAFCLPTFVSCAWAQLDEQLIQRMPAIVRGVGEPGARQGPEVQREIKHDSSPRLLDLQSNPSNFRSRRRPFRRMPHRDTTICDFSDKRY